MVLEVGRNNGLSTFDCAAAAAFAYLLFATAIFVQILLRYGLAQTGKIGESSEKGKVNVSSSKEHHLPRVASQTKTKLFPTQMIITDTFVYDHYIKSQVFKEKRKRFATKLLFFLTLTLLANTISCYFFSGHFSESS